MAQINIKQWDGKSRLKDLTPELEELNKIGTYTYNRIMELWNKYKLANFEYEQDKIYEVQSEVVNEAKKEQDLFSKYIEVFKSSAPEAYAALKEGKFGYQIDKTHSITILDRHLNGVEISSRYQVLGKMRNALQNLEACIPGIVSDYNWRKTLVDKGYWSNILIENGRSTKDVNEAIKRELEYIDVIPIFIYLWAKYSQYGDSPDLFQVYLPLIRVPSNVKFEILSWLNYDYHHALAWWRSDVSDEMFKENSAIISKEHLGIFEVSKQEITFEYFWNKYEKSALLDVSNIQLGKAGPYLVFAYEDNITPKMMGKKSWEYAPLQLYRNADIIKTASKAFKGWGIKGGKVSHEFYAKGFQVKKG